MAQSEGYKTKQRDHILQFLIENQSRHVTVDDVVDHLKQSGNPWKSHCVQIYGQVGKPRRCAKIFAGRFQRMLSIRCKQRRMCSSFSFKVYYL